MSSPQGKADAVSLEKREEEERRKMVAAVEIREAAREGG